jgi:hypothetical protein
MPWFKGNTHTHSYVSDGDTSPPEVCAWYKSHGYDFLCMTDHNHPFDPHWLEGLSIADSNFLVIPGVEITTVAERLPVHVNGLGITVMPELRMYASITECLQGAIEGIRALGGVPIVNHPNFHWALEAGHLLPLKNCKLFEVWNASTDCNNLGVGGAKSTDQFWDGLSNAGQAWFGMASDDAHDFQGEFYGYKSLPGQAWTVVRAAQLTQAAILTALEAGDFYSTTGIILKNLEVTGRTLTLEIEPAHHYKFSAELVAPDGTILETAHGLTASFMLPEGVATARVRVFDSDGSRLWTQPFGKQ